MAFDTVAVVDDNDVKRETLKDVLAVVDIDARLLAGPFDSVDHLVQCVQHEAKAAVCDHHLISNYAEFSGAMGVAALYEVKVPAVLVTAFGKAEMLEIRTYRRRVPVLLTPKQANPDALVRGFELCQNEFGGRFIPTREPWKTMVRIEDIDKTMVYAILPGWNSEEIVKFEAGLLPDSIRQQATAGLRLYATVNKGAEDQAELYFENFQLANA